MKRTISLVLQLIFLSASILASVFLWQYKDHLSDVFARIAPTGEQEPIKSKRSQELPVVVKRVSSAANNEIIEALGTGRAKKFITLYPETNGEITKFNVETGTKVQQGDILLELDPKTAELAKRVAETKLIESERLMVRAKELRKKNINSAANVDDAQNLMKRAEIELRQAEEALRDRRVIAPFNGIIGIPKVEAGDRVTTTTALMTLDDRSEIIVEFRVPELFLSRVKAGDKIYARTPNYEQKTFTGIIDQIDSRIDPQNRSVTVRAVLDNKEDLLRPGMSFTTEVRLKGKTYPLVPELALLWSKGKSHVWKVSKGQAEKIPVRIVRRLNSTIIIDGKLSKGDLVVVEGVQRLREGSKVSFIEPPLSTTSLSN